MLAEFKFHHIGYAVEAIEPTAEVYRNAGWEITEEVIDPLQNVRISFAHKEGMPLIEFVAPVDENSPVVDILNKNGQTATPYHICYEVENIEMAIKQLRKMRYVALFNPVPAIALHGRLICYLYKKEIGLIELVQ